MEGTNNGMEKKVVSIQPDSPINFLQLSNLYSLVGAGDILDISLNQILWRGRISKADFASSKLNKVEEKSLNIHHQLNILVLGNPADWFV